MYTRTGKSILILTIYDLPRVLVFAIFNNIDYLQNWPSIQNNILLYALRIIKSPVQLSEVSRACRYDADYLIPRWGATHHAVPPHTASKQTPPCI